MKMRYLKTILLLAALNGCATKDRFKEYEKEHNDPQPTRYEAPFHQIRETDENQKPEDYAVQTLPKDEATKPQVIEPDPYSTPHNPILSGIAIKGRPGFVLSPYAPDKGLVDVRGFPVGSDVRDPYTGKIMKVPVPTEEKKTKIEETTLSAPKSDNPLPDPNAPPTIEK